MELGVQYIEPLDLGAIAEAGFSYAEIPFAVLEENKLPTYQKKEGEGKVLMVSGLIYPLEKTTPDKLYDMLVTAQQYQANYIVLETVGCKEDVFSELVEECSMMICDFGIPIFLENGMVGDDTIGYCHSVYSDADSLVKMADYGNRLCERPMIGVCINTGYANVLGKNIRRQIYQCKEYLCMVHINDNDGIHNAMQMPYTFTQGRGRLITDWPHIIGELMRMEFGGWMIFDTRGLFRRSPVELQEQFMRMLRQIARVWEHQFVFEERILNQPEKKLILFGAGQMAVDYMRLFGEKYPPVFIVDNLQQRWGKELCGIQIRNPQEILSVPEEERNVLLCCMYYNEIGTQLRQMGVGYQEFIDQYYL